MAANFVDLAGEIVAELDNEFEANLIEAVKAHKCLYATDHPDYENMQENKIAWITIAHGLQKTVIECMNKWYALLQIFLYQFKLENNNVTPSAVIMWPHYKKIKEIQPFLAENYSDLIQMKPPLLYGKPSMAQKDLLLTELEINRAILVGTNSTMIQRQEIWSQIASKLNTVQPGAKMPVIKWQKYWWDLKQNVGVQRSWIRMKLQAMGTQIDVSKFSDEDERILKFCGATTTDTPSCISAHLTCNVEFGSDKDRIIRKCKKCTIILNELVVHDYCDSCRKFSKTFCDICSKSHVEELIVFNVESWSTQARGLLPSALYSFAEISMCTVCSNHLKKQAALAWKACRICESYNQTLDNLYTPPNDNLRKVFKDATNIEFSQGDGLPGYICKICKVQMQQFNNFYLRFSRAQIRLREIHLEKFIGLAPRRQSVKRKSTNSIISANKVMILKPEEDTSKPDLTITQQNYTLKPRCESEILTSTNIGATTTQPIYTLSQGSVSVSSKYVYPKMTVVKRICTTQPKSTPVVSLSCGGVTVAKQIIPAPTTITKQNFTPPQGPVSVVKSTCAVHPGPGSVEPINANIGIKRISAAAWSSASTSKANFTVQKISTPDNPIYSSAGATKVVRAIQSGSLPIITKVGSTIVKRSRSILQKPAPISPTFTVNRAMSTKEIDALPRGPALSPINTGATTKGSSPFPPGPSPVIPTSTNTGTVLGKRMQTSQPAVFTISGEMFDYEVQHDSPPVFCIPKSGPALKTFNAKSSPTQPLPKTTSFASPALKTFNAKNSPTQPLPKTTSFTMKDNTISTTIHPVIKTEKIDDDYPGEQSATSTSLSQPNHNSVPDSDISSNASTISAESANLSQSQRELTPKRMKLVRLDGSTVVLNPNRSISKNSSFQNAFESTKFQLMQPKKVVNGRLTSSVVGEPSYPAKVNSGQKPQAYPLATEEQRQQHQQQQTSVNKRPRKYWGAVDEFQITLASEKANSNNSKPIMQRRMTIHDGMMNTPWAENSPVTTANSTSNTSLPSEEIPTNVVVKREDIQPSMFYPDSFELGNVSLDADVSSIISKMMSKHESIDDNMKSFEYINPSFLASYAQNQDLSREEDECKEKEKNQPQDHKPEINNSKEEDQHKESTPEEEEKHKENTSEDVKPNIKFPVKKLRVKIKRDEGLTKLTPTLKKQPSHQPPKLLITRKSLRRSNACKDSKLRT